MKDRTFTRANTDLVKGVAILLMMYHHCFLSPDRYEGFDVSFFPLSQNTGTDIAMMAKCCVGIFTFLSGYGMACSFQKASPDLHFTRAQAERLTIRRLFRLMSGFLAAYLVGLIGSFIYGGARSPVAIYGAEENLPVALFYALLDAGGISFLLDTPTLCSTWWYISFAIFLVLLMPVLLLLYRRCGVVLLPGLLAAIAGMGMEITFLSRWIVIAVFGILCADHDLLFRSKQWKLLPHRGLDWALRLVLLTGALAVLTYYQVWNYGRSNYITYILDLLSAFAVILWSYWFLEDIPVVREILRFLGRYSMDIFLLHTFIRLTWCHELVYSRGHALVISGLLLLLSLAMAIGLDLIKRYSGYDRLMERLQEKVLARFPG